MARSAPSRAEEESPLLGVVVPTLNEAEHLPALLDDLSALSLPHRVVVVDGGSSDGTRRLAREKGAVVRTAPRGRASQLNLGARGLGTPWLLFLHADVRIPPATRRALAEWLERAGPKTAGVFRFRLAGDDRFWRFVELGQRLRERVSGLAYGDQGLVVHRTAFREVGGYPELPIMEDVEIVRRLRRSHRVERIPADIVSSPRRYEREGRWLGWLRNAALITLHLVGVPPRHLRRWYRDDGPAPDARGGTGARAREPGRRTLLVFAKAPTVGKVKTRLAADIGDRRAARLYRRLGRRVVDQVRGGPYRTVLCFDPPDAEDEIRTWLGDDDLCFRAQTPGGLGARMAAAFESAFRGAARVCIIGTDTPTVDRDAVIEAFRALDDADVVLGPASDGGYYLLALDRPRPTLFDDVPWSTDAVLRTTLERAKDEGLRVRLLAERTDLDTVDDLRTLGLEDLAE